MVKSKTVYACQNCGFQAPKWMGRCPQCQRWSTMVEEIIGGEAAAPSASLAKAATPRPITETQAEEAPRLPSGLDELDRLLGGGWVPGSTVLLGGDPGIGKSTLVLQTLAHLGSKTPTLYVSGEESAHQIRLRAQRLGALRDGIMLLTETDVEVIAATAEKMRPALLVVDSIQTLRHPELDGAPGSVGQVRECAARLTAAARLSGVPTVLIGHITKEGSIAGPKMLEHMVDAVLYFEGDRGHHYRLLRVIKNRFGPTGDLALFEMTGEGLAPVRNPSEWLLSGRPLGMSGSAVTVAMEGTRPLMVEVQALVSPGYGQGMIPRRVSSGMDPARVALIIAVLEKRCGISLGSADIFVKVSGGMRLDDPGADLALAAALISSALDRPLGAQDCFVGEVGLSGEVRGVGQWDARWAEAGRLGFQQIWTAPPAGAKKGKGTREGAGVVVCASVRDLAAGLRGE